MMVIHELAPSPYLKEESKCEFIFFLHPVDKEEWDSSWMGI